MDFPEGQHHFASGQHLHITFVKKNLKHFLFRTKESLTFLRDYIILPPEKKIDKKILHPSVSQSSHDLLGNKKPLSHFSSGDHIYEGMLSFSPHAPLQNYILTERFVSFSLNWMKKLFVTLPGIFFTWRHP